MKPIPYRRIWLITLMPLATATLASVLFLAQGGFVAGHGKFDGGILVLALPSVLLDAPFRIIGEWLIAETRLDELKLFNLLMVIWVPALMNLFLFWIPLAYLLSWLEYWRRGRRTASGKEGLPEV